MTFIIASEARKSLYRLIDHVSINHEPTLIKGKRNTAVLLSIEDWEDIQETLLVASHKELSLSLIEGKNTPYEECSSDLE
jgi:PHD/YefM family antitoxin component YafN of YafNO toxin-antitoxin module